MRKPYLGSFLHRAYPATGALKGDLISRVTSDIANVQTFITSGLLGSITEPHITLNKDGVVTDVNAAFCQLCQRTENDILGNSMADLFVNPQSVAGSIQEVFHVTPTHVDRDR